jgi:hypothetical protein
MVPGTFLYNNKEHIGFDGGYRSIIPIPIHDYKSVDIVSCTPTDRMKMKNDFNKKGILSLLSRSIEIFEDEVYDRDLTTLLFSHCENINIYAPLEYPGEALDASREAILYRYKLGEQAYINPIIYK